MTAPPIRPLLVSIVIGMLLSAGVAAADGRKSVPSLCATPGQETLFTCQAGSKTISVCYSPTKDSTEGELAYIYGVAGKPAEIALHGSPATVKFSQNTGASGRNFFLAFLNGTYSYVVYKNEDKYDMPMNASGVVVKNAGKQIAWLGCTTDNDTTETIWHLDSHPELVSADSTTTTNIKLPDEPLTPCGWLPKADFKKYCNY